MLYRFQSAVEIDTAFVRDNLVTTLHINDHGVTSDPTGLCEDLNDILMAGWYDTGGYKITTKAYNAEAPGGPEGQATKNPAASNFNSASPREVALCLSYYAETNAPRKRGRIYLPCGHISSLGKRPTAPIIAKALALGDAFAGLGGADCDWVVYSPTAGNSNNVTNTWVDNEWDTMRSRGLRADARSTGTPGA